MQTETIIAIVSIAGGICTIFSFLIGRNSAAKKSGFEEGKLSTDIGYIKIRIDEILSEQIQNTVKINDQQEHIARVEESTKQAHKRIDEITELIRQK